MSTPTEYAPIHESLNPSSRSSSIEDLAQKLQDIIESERTASPSAQTAPLVIRRSAWEYKDNEYPAAPCPTPISSRHQTFAAAPLMKV
jgi:hypothetical protein